MILQRFDLPQLGIGVGLRSAHYEHILATRPDVEWFEVLADNYMNTSGRPLSYLDQIAERYPVVLHAVGLSIGSVDALDFDYLRQLRALRDRCGALWLSDHVAWSGVNGRHGHDLYPVPFTEECLRHIARRVAVVQDFLEAPLVLENPSTYLEFEGSTLSEAEFIGALLEESDSGLLLDVNNLYVNAHNHGFDAHAYLSQLPLERVVQLHVAGHDVRKSSLVGETRSPRGVSPNVEGVPSADSPNWPVSTRPSPTGDAAKPGTDLRHEVLVRAQRETYLIDTHGGPVAAGVWALLEEVVRLGARAPLLLEWDADVPAFEEVHREALGARLHLERALSI